MGQKVSPISLRLNITRTWDSIWYASKQDYTDILHQDFAIRRTVKETHRRSSITKIGIERFAEKVHIKLYCVKPGVVIGQKGKNIEMLKSRLSRIVNKSIEVKVVEVSHPDLSAQSLADTVASQLEERVSFRRAMKHAIHTTVRGGVQGVKIIVSGRLNGADMARSQKYSEGRVPLHTLRAMIDYAFAEADTTYGKIGIKIWVYGGDYLGNEKNQQTNKNNMSSNSKSYLNMQKPNHERFSRR